ncbi:pirin-like C-terminal cupin domain-containing protein [Testudinibacter sp. P27/CKL/0425]
MKRQNWYFAAHGPFVMNSREELLEKFQAFNRGEFGDL